MSAGEDTLQRQGRPPGRPRSAAADEAILDATLATLVQDGYRAMSMESVRLRAGVGKATVYRRYKSKQELVVAAVERVSELDPPGDMGSFRADFEELLDVVLRTLYVPRMATFMPRLMAEAVDDEELHAIFYARLVEPRRETVRELVRRAVRRGELPADADEELIVDLLVGPLIYRVIISGGRPERLGRDPMGVFDAVYAGIAADAAAGPPAAAG